MDLFSNVSGKRRLKSNARLHYPSRRNSVVAATAANAASVKPPHDQQQQPTQSNTSDHAKATTTLSKRPPTLPHTSFLAKRAAPVLNRSYNSMPCIPREPWATIGISYYASFIYRYHHLTQVRVRVCVCHRIREP